MDTVGNMDPYVELSINGVGMQRTKIHKDGGRAPRWNEMFKLYA
jgi:hypothetical protein